MICRHCRKLIEFRDLDQKWVSCAQKMIITDCLWSKERGVEYAKMFSHEPEEPLITLVREVRDVSG